MGDVNDFVPTLTNDSNSSETNSTPVIAGVQSYENLETHTNSVIAERPSSSRVQLDGDELNLSSFEHVNSEHSDNVTVSQDEKYLVEDACPVKETITSENLPRNDVLCDENIDRCNSEVPLSDVQPSSNCDTTPTASQSDISTTNNMIDSLNEVNNHLSALSNCTGLDKTNYSVEFVENLSKIEKNNSLMPADLISSETMTDFFDEMYDTNYVNHYKIRKDDEDSNAVQNSSSLDVVDGNLKDQIWSVTHESESCSHPVVQRDNNGVIKSSLKRSVEPDSNTNYLPCKKAKKGITFDSVSVYYFPRTQGFTCIPSQGGSTLGMSRNHTHIRKFSLGEHAAEQRKIHRQLCSQQFTSSRNWNELPNVSSDDSDSDEIISDSEVDYENYNFLQPIPTRERRAMLRASGIHKIDSREKDECRTIRLSREFCGCTCQIYCDPERCVCAQAGIKCQVDRMNFPCSCTREGCANENGRIEFNPVRVRTHFIHTLMRLEVEKKKEEEDEHNHRLLFGDLDPMSQLSAYPLSSSASSLGGGDCGANVLATFSYHHDPLSYYAQPPPLPHQQPSLYDVTSTVASTSSSNSAQSPLPPFSYDSHHQYVMTTIGGAAGTATDDSVSSYSQLTSVSNLTVLGESGGTSSLAAEYSVSGEQCLRLAADFDDVSSMSELQQQQQQPSLHQLHQQHQQPTLQQLQQQATLHQLQQQLPGFHDVYDVTDNSAVAAATAVAYHSADSFMRFAENAAKERSIECQSEGETLDTSAEISEETEKEEESDLENFGDIIKKTMVESVIA